MLFRSVLDIDLIENKYSRFAPKTKEEINNILNKISSCKFCGKKPKIKSSSFKGFHVILWCHKKCDVCRICYDDCKHFDYDSNRPEYARNILFDEKVKVIV